MWFVDVLLLLQEILGLVNQPLDHVLQSPATVLDIKEPWILIFHVTLQIKKRLSHNTLNLNFLFLVQCCLCVCVLGGGGGVHVTGPHHARVFFWI